MDLQRELIPIDNYEQVIKFTERDSGLKAIIAIHNTKLGPGLGGTRIYPYKRFEDALEDVLRLSKGMTYKAGMCQAGLGGAKSVIIADPKKDKTVPLLHAFAEAVNSLKGQYVCAEDLGCTPADIDVIIQKTKYACGVHNLRGSGNPSNYTAWGTLQGIKSICQQLDGHPSIEGKTIALQGVGSVGRCLIELLFWEGANLIISDKDKSKLSECAHRYSAKIVDPQEIISTECDIFSPNAMGGILNEQTIPELNCRAVAGAANNQLQKASDADAIYKRGILYAPDFVINAGGLINVIHELNEKGYQSASAREMTRKIYHRLLNIYETAEKNSISTHQAAVSVVDYRLEHEIGKRTEELVFRFQENSNSNSAVQP